MSRLVLPDMLAAGQGHIINFGSYVAIGPSPMSSAYGTSKAALLRFTDSLAEEVRDKGVVVIAVSPGWVWTDMAKAVAVQIQKMNAEREGVNPAYIFEESAICDLVCQVAEGTADRFYGRLLHVKDNLNELLAKLDELLETDRFALRFNM